MNLSIEVQGIKDLEQYLGSIPKKADAAARNAVSSATRYAYTLGRRAIQEQVNLPTNYLSGSEGGEPRFYISRRPSRGSLEGVLKGRVRATSLYRFVTNVSKRHGLTVRVKRGGASRHLLRAFSVKLKNGNRGVAIRLPKDEKPSSIGAKLYGSSANTRKTNLWLLYGPSVQQVFRDVAPEIAPKVSEYLNTEFQRQLARRL